MNHDSHDTHPSHLHVRPHAHAHAHGHPLAVPIVSVASAHAESLLAMSAGQRVLRVLPLLVLLWAGVAWALLA